MVAIDREKLGAVCEFWSPRKKCELCWDRHCTFSANIFNQLRVQQFKQKYPQ